MNTRRVGAIVSGPIIDLGPTTAPGNRGIFLTYGLLIVVALVIIAVVARHREPHPTADLLVRCRSEGYLVSAPIGAASPAADLTPAR
jgi:hypothetical protein